MKYRKKAITVEATQWFKNGDHPEDKVERACPAATDLDPFEPFLFAGLVVGFFSSSDPSTKCGFCNLPFSTHGSINTLEGQHIVCPGDWIITGINGEYYPCKSEIFEKTYDKLTSATSGDSSTSATSGENSTSSTSGFGSTSATSGCESTSATSGDSSTSATSGDFSIATATGKNSIAVCCGLGCKVKGNIGCAFVLQFLNAAGEVVPAFAVAGLNGIKPNVFYMLNKEGEFIEAGDLS